jgi:hypothetical protein
MKVLFLDIDGVCNSWAYGEKIGTLWEVVDPATAAMVRRIITTTGCKVVLSSTWRLYENCREIVRREVCEFIDVTPNMQAPGQHYGVTDRGHEIKAWLDQHPEVERYAILDDNSDMLPGQPLFLTSFDIGLTEQIATKVIKYLNYKAEYGK